MTERGSRASGKPYLLIYKERRHPFPTERTSLNNTL